MKSYMEELATDGKPLAGDKIISYILAGSRRITIPLC
jgi:hypothetical protein